MSQLSNLKLPVMQVCNNCKFERRYCTSDVAAVVAKGANIAIQQLQMYHKASAGGSKRRQVLPLFHLPLANFRNQSVEDQISQSSIDIGVSVHLPRDFAEGGDTAIAGAAVFTHTHVSPPAFESNDNHEHCRIQVDLFDAIC